MDWTAIISTLLAALIPIGSLLAIVINKYKDQWELGHPVEIQDSFEE